MIPKELVDFVEARTKIQNRELIEKDLLLHNLLIELSSDDYFSKNYAFKGGTCLMKCYLGYYRFSEDLDFTWINQKLFSNKTQGNIRTLLSSEITKVGKMLEKISKSKSLRFKADKKDRNYVEIGGSNAFVTFKLWYKSNETGQENFIKVQINYRENILYPLKKMNAENIIFGLYDKFEAPFLLPDNSEWMLQIPKITAYDVKEIFVEKVRAIATRRGVKARDFVDLYEIEKQKQLTIEKFESEIIEKIKPMLRFEKYRVNFAERAKNMPPVILGDEANLLLKPLGKDFPEFLSRIEKFVKKILISLGNK